MKYTQTTTADEPAITQPSPKEKAYFSAMLLIIFACIVFAAFSYGKSQGRAEAETEQAIKATQAKIDTIYAKKEVKATNVRQQSNNASKTSKIIREGVIVNVPVIKDTTQEEELRYLKQLKP